MLQNTRANNCECFVGFVLLPPVQQVAPSPSPFPYISLLLYLHFLPLPFHLPPPYIFLPIHLLTPLSSSPFTLPPFPSIFSTIPSPLHLPHLHSIPPPRLPSPSPSIFSFPLHLSQKGVDDQLNYLRLRITGIPFIRNTHHTEYL